MIEPQNDGAQPVPALERHKDACVLIVEDEKIVAWDMEQTLLEAGLSNVEVVNSLAAAWRILAAEERVSIVLLDLKLPDGDSSELVQELRKRSILVVIVTGYTTLHFQDVPVLYKPFTADDLVRVVGRTLEGS
jgi:DNA-binding NtrC family response regulator